MLIYIKWLAEQIVTQKSKGKEEDKSVMFYKLLVVLLARVGMCFFFFFTCLGALGHF